MIYFKYGVSYFPRKIYYFFNRMSESVSYTHLVRGKVTLSQSFSIIIIVSKDKALKIISILFVFDVEGWLEIKITHFQYRAVSCHVSEVAYCIMHSCTILIYCTRFFKLSFFLERILVVSFRLMLQQFGFFWSFFLVYNRKY